MGHTGPGRTRAHITCTEAKVLVYLNGAFVERSTATISIDDRGFLFGDGIYEVFRATDGRLFAPARHLARLRRGLAGISIVAPIADGTELVEVAERLLAENGHAGGDAMVYIEVTRGVAPRTHHFPAAATPPTVLVGTTPLSLPHALRESGASVITYPDLRWSRCDLKTINLLPNVLAKQAAVAAGAAEAILVRDGVVTEAAHSNVFAVLAGEIRTHPATHRILPGVTREVVLELAASRHLPVREEAVLVSELAEASEIFLTSTTGDVLPVTRVDGRPVGGADGRPGPVAGMLYDALREVMARDERPPRAWEATGPRATGRD